MKTTLDTLGVAMLLMASGSLAATFSLHWAARKKLARRRRLPSARSGPISVLKPLCGVDDGLYENLVSFARQDHPDFELILGVADPFDPALAVAQRLRAEFPSVAIRVLVHGEADSIANPKVITLVHALRIARHELVLVSDSNVRVAPDYLRNLGAEISDPEVGLVSNLIVGMGEETFGARCETLHLNTFVIGGVCIGDVSDRPCVVGKSMLMRKRELAALGGFESMRDVLAEDYLLGQRYHEAGFRVVLSCDPIRTEHRQLTFTRFMSRHLRWAQLRRWCAIGPFCSEPLLYASPWLAAPMLVQDSIHDLSWVCAAALLARIGSDGMLARKVTGQWPSLGMLALIPLKDTLMLGVWAVALCRRNVHWRGHSLRIGPGTRLQAREDGLRDRTAHAA